MNITPPAVVSMPLPAESDHWVVFVQAMRFVVGSIATILPALYSPIGRYFASLLQAALIRPAPKYISPVSGSNDSADQTAPPTLPGVTMVALSQNGVNRQPTR